MGPASRRILAGMNPRQRRGILLLTLVRPGAARRVRARGGVRGGCPRGGGSRRSRSSPSRSRRRRTSRSRTTWSGRRSCRADGRRRRSLRDRARLIGQVALADIPAGSVLQEGMIGSPPELATGEREIAILVDAETGVAGKIDPGSIVDIVATFGGNDQQGDPARVRRRRAGRADHRRRPARAQGRQRACRSRPPTRTRSSPSRSRSSPREALTVTYAESLRRRGPPRAAAARRGVRAQEEGARVPPPDPEPGASEPAAADRDRRRRPRGRRRPRSPPRARSSRSSSGSPSRRSSRAALRRLDVDVVALHDALGTVPVMELAREIASELPRGRDGPARRRTRRPS